MRLELEMLAVASDQQGNGIGRRLLEHLRRHAASRNMGVFVFCLRDTEEFFEKMGFECVGEYVLERPKLEVLGFWSPPGKIE